MGKTRDEEQKKKKTPKEEIVDSAESSDTDSRPESTEGGDSIEDIEKSILVLREKGKKNPNLDFLKELRKIQDSISDIKGEARRPITAVTPAIKKNMARGQKTKKEKDVSLSSDEEDPDATEKELINKRLTTCMMLALSFENDEDYPTDFYEKLSDSKKFDEIIQPFKKDEVKLINQLIKDRKKITEKRRIKHCRVESS